MLDFEAQQEAIKNRMRQYSGQQYEAPQGQMIGGNFIAPNAFQHIAAALRGYGGIKGTAMAEQELKDLSAKRQTSMTDALRGYTTNMMGTPASEATKEMFVADDAGGGEMTMGTQVTPAVAPNPLAAYQSLANAPDAAMRQSGMTGMMNMQAEQAKLAQAQAQNQKYMGILSSATDPQAAIRAGVPASVVTDYYNARNLNKDKVARTVEVEGLKGEKLLQQKDEFGNNVGDPIPAYMAPQAVNQGNKTTFVKPVAGQSFAINMAPGEAARLRQQAEQFQQTQNTPTFSAEAGGFVYKPTASNPQGSVVKVAGLPDKPLNESQGNATTFGIRMAAADKILTELENSGLQDTGKIRTGVSGTLGAIPLIGDSLRGGSDNVFNALPSIMGGLSKDQQKTMNARINFITAILRDESGASIASSEFATAEKLYFPAPGDPPEVVRQKQAARQQALKGIKTQAGPGAKTIDEGMPDATNATTTSGW